MPTVDENAVTLSGAQFQSLQATTLAALIGTPPTGAMGPSDSVPLSEWNNGAVIMGSAANTQALREANLVQMHAWRDYCIANDLIMYLDGTVQIHGSTGFDLRDRSFRLEGMHTGSAQDVGARRGSQIRNFLVNTPHVQCGETTAGTYFTQPRMNNIVADSGAVNTSAHTSSCGFRMGQTYLYSSFRNLTVGGCADGFVHLSGDLFSCLFDSIFVNAFKNWAWRFESGGTGNIINGFHVTGDTANPPTVKGGIWQKFSTTGCWNQINLEWFKFDTAGLLLEVCRNQIFNSLNLESLDPFNNKAQVELVWGNYGHVFNAVKVQTPEFTTANGTTAGSIFRGNGGNSISVDGLHIQEVSKTGATFHIIGTKIPDGLSASDNFWLRNIKHVDQDTAGLDGIDNYTVHAARTGVSPIKEFNGYMVPGGGFTESLTDASGDIHHWDSAGDPEYPNILLTAPLSAARTRTLKSTMRAASGVTVPVGMRMKITRSLASTGNFPYIVAADGGTELVQLYTGEWASFHTDSSRAWVVDAFGRLVPGTVRTIPGLAAAGDEQLEGVPLVPGFNIIATSTATTADGALLPTAVKDLRVEVRNKTANAIDVWPHTSDQINGGTVNTGVLNIPAGDLGIFVAEDATNWHGLVVAGTHA